MSGFNVKIPTGAGELTVLEPGSYDALLHGVVDLGVHETEFQGQSTGRKRLIKFIFEIPSVTLDSGESLVIGFKDSPLSASPKSNVAKIVTALTGVKEPKDIVKILNGNLESLLGKPLSLQIKNFKTNSGDTRHAIESVSKLDERITPPDARREGFVFTFDGADVDVFRDKLTKYTQDKILSAENADELPAEIHQAAADRAESEINSSALG